MKTDNLKINIYKSENEVDWRAFNIVKRQIFEKPNSAFILPSGATQIGWYKLVVDACRKREVDFEKVTIFNLDEYYPLQKNHPSSYYSYMRKNLLDHVNVKPENWHIPNSEAETPQKAVKDYQGLIDAQKEFDLAILGVGPGTTCHIGFNEQSSDKNSKTRYVILDEQTEAVNSHYFSSPEEMPKGAITMGIADILKAKRIILLAKGHEKAWGIQRTILGPINSEAPASFLRLHENVEFILDRKAASLL